MVIEVVYLNRSPPYACEVIGWVEFVHVHRRCIEFQLLLMLLRCAPSYSK